MANAKKTSSAKTNAYFHHLCSIKVRSGEQEYIIYELKCSESPLTEQNYYREVLEFCGYGADVIDKRLQEIEEEGRFAEWPYDDRLYTDPWLQDITEAEHEVLRKFLHCR